MGDDRLRAAPAGLVAETDRGHQSGRHEPRVGDRCQLDHPHPVGVMPELELGCGQLVGEAGLARPARADDAQQPRRGQQPGPERQLLLAAEEGRQLDGKVVVGDVDWSRLWRVNPGPPLSTDEGSASRPAGCGPPRPPVGRRCPARRCPARRCPARRCPARRCPARRERCGGPSPSVVGKVERLGRRVDRRRRRLRRFSCTKPALTRPAPRDHERMAPPERAWPPPARPSARWARRPPSAPG